MADRADPTERIKHYNKVLEGLRKERSSFMSLWRELSDYIMGYRGRFTVTDRNKGHKRNTKQINNTASRARRTIGSGMMAGMSSPSRPWFRLGIADRTLRESGPVKEWLKDVQDLLLEIFSESNFYPSIAQLYLELATFATSAIGVFKDFDNVIHCRTYTVGSYFLSSNGKGVIDTFAREYQLKVSQVVSEFGIQNVTEATKNNFNNGNTETWVDIVHFVEPNDTRDHMSPLAGDMPWRSVYYEKGAANTKFLRESGFLEFPILTPRWDVTDEDDYGTECPGMTALGDAKALQVLEKKKAQAVDKLVDPPLMAPSEMKGRRISLIPGEVSYVDTNTPGQGVKPIYEINPQLADLREDISATEFRVNAAFFVDLFLMFANIENRERVTAEEIIEKKAEKLLMLGPMLERSQNELFDLLIDRVFNIALRGGIIPDPPPELEGQPLRIEYISVLQTAQKSVATDSIEKVAGFVANIAELKPEALDKLDGDQMVDEYAEAVGVAPGIVLSDDDVAALRAAAARQAVMDRAAAAAVPATEGVQNLAGADTSGKNALTDTLDAVRP